ncbi:MAG: ethylbenzene dehydrogenase-related protein [Haloarculaceae archaeon]
MTDALDGWIDGRAASRATAVAVLTVILLVAVQGAVTAALTSGQQPVGEVARLPRSPTANQWDAAPSRTVTLSKQQMAIPYGGGSTDEVTVAALTNETHVGFRLTWHDPTNDTSLSGPQQYSDAAAVMLNGGQTPPITMGGTGDPVNIWYWRAAWQYGSNRAPWSGDMYAYPHPDNETKPGLAANNPLSKRHYREFAQNYYAKGFGSLSHAPRQNVHAAAVREGDTWSVAFVRERSTTGTYDAAFDDHGTMYLAFAVWNGSAGEVNGQKSITLQFTTMDTNSGQLSAASSGGGSASGSSTGGSGTASSGESGGTGGPTTELVRYLTMLVGATLIAWLVTYWRTLQ